MRTHRTTYITTLVLALGFLACTQTLDARIEAVRGKSYKLGKQHGPWMIMVASFRNVDEEHRVQGLSAAEAASELVYELRQKGIPAYVFEQRGEIAHVSTRDRTGRPDRRIYAAKRGMISVLAGNYNSIDSEQKTGRVAQKTLKYIKQLNPKIMEQGGRYRPTPGRPSPLSGAFLTVNPMLSTNDILSRKSDPLLAKLNAGMEHSLLNNPGKYTLVVKSISGKSITKLADSSFADVISRFDSGFKNSLDDAAESAWELTQAMRNAKELGYSTNYEAYVFHDRFRSLVTVGSFDSPQDPRITQLARFFEGKIKQHPQTGKQFLAGELFTIPRKPQLNKPHKSWVFDPQPQIMKVPRLAR